MADVVHKEIFKVPASASSYLHFTFHVLDADEDRGGALTFKASI